MGSSWGIVSAGQIDSFFSVTTNSQDQLDSLANSSLSRGITRYTKNDYAGAATDFKRALGLSPSSANAGKTYDYLAQAYLQQGKTDQAIKTYKDAIKANPADDTFHLKLGDIYNKAGQTNEALAEYSKAVKLNPYSAENRYSLGQIYLTSGQLPEAQTQFSKVPQLAPNSPTGFYGLGQVFRQMGKYNDAVFQLNQAVTMDKKFANGFLELGYTYADMGDMDKAQNQVKSLQGLQATTQVAALQNYMSKVSNPKIIAAFSSNGFPSSSGPGTLLSDMDSSLSSAYGSKRYNMTFLFSKDMDLNSVQNIANWQIGRQAGTYVSQYYNFGLPIPTTEVKTPLLPAGVVYNPDSRIAEVSFTISQNAEATGTIDPSHILIKFTGKDSYGKAMDPTADEYSGFSQIV